MELQQVGLQRFHDVLDVATRVVHGQRDHCDLFRHQVAQHARLAEQQPARTVRREHQADVVHAQLDRQADILGTRQATEFDAHVHGGEKVGRRGSVAAFGGSRGAGPCRRDLSAGRTCLEKQCGHGPLQWRRGRDGRVLQRHFRGQLPLRRV